MVTHREALVPPDEILQAAMRLDGAINRTPFLLSLTLSEITGAEVWLKFENLQFTASFKERGALNRLAVLDHDARQRGVVAVSAGNHAQGVALHARRLGIDATIIMPVGTPQVKIKRTESFGARVILAGRNFAEASAQVAQYVDQGLQFIHPFDDPLVIAGQGTVGLEMIDDGPQLDVVVIAVGGGGLISGVGSIFAARSPATEILGVQSARYPGMAVSLGYHTGPVPGGTSIAEGIAVASPGTLTLRCVKSLGCEIFVVEERRIEDAVALLLQVEKTLCEGAGAAGLAAVLQNSSRFRGRRVGLILCGGNIDMRLLIAMLQRHLARSGQLVRLRVTALDRAGFLGEIASEIGRHGGNIVDVHHDRIFADTSAHAANIDFQVELPEGVDCRHLVDTLRRSGFPTELLPLAGEADHSDRRP